MTWLSLICSSLLAVSLQAAAVSGSVELKGSRVAAVTRDKDYSGVVLSLRPVGAPAPAAPAKHATMLQKNKMFTPHILPVVAGTTIDFPNADPIFHNAFSSYSGQVFDVGLYPPGTSRSVRIQRPGLVRVFCNIHPSMSAVILVLATPYFTETARDGSFKLDVPAGTYDLDVFHERATEETLQTLSRRVIVGPDAVHLDKLEISEAGYLMAPHKNKYGKDYDPPPDDRIFYPGAPQ
jgi:plastocyanin